MKSLMMIIAMVFILAACGESMPGEDMTVDQGNIEATEGPEEVAPEAEATEEEPPQATETEEETSLQPAVDFTMTDWQGEEITLSQYQGKIVFLNFFATWCPPCQKEMPEFQQAYEDYEGDVVFQIVDVYTSEKISVDEVKQWYTDGGYTMPMIIDEDGSLNKFYPLRVFPTTVVINRQGEVVYAIEGGMDRAVIDTVIAQVDGY